MMPDRPRPHPQTPPTPPAADPVFDDSTYVNPLLTENFACRVPLPSRVSSFMASQRGSSTYGGCP
jgi:hypothetical protein